jgi:hypothetical protein
MTYQKIYNAALANPEAFREEKEKKLLGMSFPKAYFLLTKTGCIAGTKAES